MAEESLKQKTARGLFWGLVNNGTMQFLNLLFGICLGRLLGPDDYGMVGMLTIFSLIAGSLQESGFTAALANKKDIRHDDYNAVFWFSASVSFLLYWILFFCAPLIADFYHQPELVSLGRYSFLGFFISSLGIAPAAYVFRNLLVKQKAIATALGLIVSGIIGITLAYCGFSYWGLATQSLIYVAVLNLYLWIVCPWRPTFTFNFRPIREMFGFSSKLLLTNIFDHINNNLFSIVLGKFYSEREVGNYNQANKWNNMGASTISGMVANVAQPILAIGGAFQPIMKLYANLLVSRGKSNFFLLNTVALGFVQLLIMLFSYPLGIRMMVLLYVCVNILWWVFWHIFAYREIHICLRSVIKDILPFVCIAAGVIGIVFLFTQNITNIYYRIIAKVSFTAILYIFLMWLLGSTTFRESFEFVKNKLNLRRL